MIEFELDLFAVFKEEHGSNQLQLSFDAPPEVATLITRLQGHWPNLSDVLCKSRIAVNNQFRDDKYLIQQGDKVALIPPVSGG